MHDAWGGGHGINLSKNHLMGPVKGMPTQLPKTPGAFANQKDNINEDCESCYIPYHACPSVQSVQTGCAAHHLASLLRMYWGIFPWS
jgi:hypothetical protein